MKKEFTTIGITERTKGLLDSLKIHPRQSYEEVILVLAKDRGVEVTEKERIAVKAEEWRKGDYYPPQGIEFVDWSDTNYSDGFLIKHNRVKRAIISGIEVTV